MRMHNTLGLIATAGMTGLIAVLLTSTPSSARPIAEPPSPLDYAVAMHRIGLDQPALAAIGADESAATAIAENLMSAYLTRHHALRALDGSVGDARHTISELERAIRSGKAGQEAVDQLAAARTQLEFVTGERDAILSTLYQEATSEVAGPAMTTLATIKDNRHWGLPIAYLTSDRSEQDWVNLRTALACVRIAADGGSPVNAQTEAVLEAAHLDPAYITAATNLSLYADDVAEAWGETIGVE